MAWAAGMGFRASTAVRDLWRDQTSMSLGEVERFDERRHHPVWCAMARDLTCAVVRDPSYLNWKYVEQPGQEFLRLELVESGEVKALAVWALREPDAAYRYRRAQLVDIVAPLSDAALLQRILRGACAAAAAAGADALHCMHTDGRLTAALRAVGFHLRQPQRYLLIDPGPLAGAALEQALAADSWFVTQGDSDIDRPW
jgi:hypothetical protein